jgi:hypothetical protein
VAITTVLPFPVAKLFPVLILLRLICKVAYVGTRAAFVILSVAKNLKKAVMEAVEQHVL